LAIIVSDCSLNFELQAKEYWEKTLGLPPERFAAENPTGGRESWLVGFSREGGVSMLLEAGSKIHVMTRRGFEEDLRRHFVGEVTACADGVVRAKGYAFVFDARLNEFVRRPDERDRILSLVDVGNIVNVLPDSADIEASNYRMSHDGRLVVTDGGSFSLDINEFGAIR